MAELTAALGRLVHRARAALESRAAPVVAGLATGLLVGWLWGSLDPLPWVYDESAYLLQSKIFATFHWSVAGPPLPKFFEQMHVFVTPRLVPKYPPGHALLMVPGVWLGLPGLVPLLASGLTGALVFSLARTLTRNPWVALVAWAVWITSPVALYIRPSYLSQTTTGLLWLVGWWALLRWADDGRLRWLLLFAAAAAWGAISRPVSMVPFGLVAGVWLLARLKRQGTFRPLGPMLALMLPILSIVPFWSWRTSGRAFPTPYTEYSRVYAPWNLPGFKVDSSPPVREPFPALRKFRTEFLPQHEAHRLAALPGILLQRVKWIAITFWGEHGLRWALLPLGLFGLVRLPRPARLALATAGLLVLAYLWMAARPRWTVYYLEAMPVLALATGIGVVALARRIGKLRGGDTMVGSLILGGFLVAAPGTIDRLVRARQAQEDLRFLPDELETALRSIEGRAVVFLRPGPVHRPYESMVRNTTNAETTRIWVVHDRGPANRRLLAVAPDRAAYVFDPGTGRLAPWTGGGPNR